VTDSDGFFPYPSLSVTTYYFIIIGATC
jgi:hypothetical protein